MYPAFFWLLVPSKGTRLKSSNSEQTSRLLQCICPFRLTVQKNLHEPSLFSQECSQTSPASVPKPRWARRRVPAGRGRVPAHAALRSSGGEGQPEARHCRGRRGPRSRRLSPRSWPSPRASADARCVSHAGAPAPPSGLLGSARRSPRTSGRRPPHHVLARSERAWHSAGARRCRPARGCRTQPERHLEPGLGCRREGRAAWEAWGAGRPAQRSCSQRTPGRVRPPDPALPAIK